MSWPCLACTYEQAIQCLPKLHKGQTYKLAYKTHHGTACFNINPTYTRYVKKSQEQRANVNICEHALMCSILYLPADMSYPSEPHGLHFAGVAVLRYLMPMLLLNLQNCDEENLF